MKTFLKLLTGLFFLPWLALGGIIAICRLLFTITFGFAWQKGDDWCGAMLMKTSEFLNSLKNNQKQ